MKANRMLGVASLAVVLPALAAAQSTTFDYDRSAPFAQYHTYALKEGTTTGDSLIDARIVAALDRELAFRGLRKSAQSPDVYVWVRRRMTGAGGHYCLPVVGAGRFAVPECSGIVTPRCSLNVETRAMSALPPRCSDIRLNTRSATRATSASGA